MLMPPPTPLSQTQDLVDEQRLSQLLQTRCVYMCVCVCLSE
jgi:hypothetical protein